MKPPNISIITISYNCKAELDVTIRSVSEQDYEDFEFVIIDGGSKDGTIELIEASKDIVDFYVSEPDDGVADAFNKGIQMAQGQWLIFMNSGDTFARADVLSRVANVLKDSCAGVVYGDIQIDFLERRIGHVRDILNSDRINNSICHQACFIRRDIQMEQRYDGRFRYAMDFELWHRLLLTKCVSFEHVEVTVANYKLGGLTSSTSHAMRSFFEHWLVKCLYFKESPWVHVIRLVHKLAMLTLKVFLKIILGGKFYSILKSFLVR